MSGQAVIGVDQGKGGGIALLFGGYAEVIAMPMGPARKGGADYDWSKILTVIRDHAAWAEDQGCSINLFFEYAQSMPKAGCKANWWRGYSAGAWELLCATEAIPFQRVHPKTWHAALKASPDKKANVALAQRLFPTVKLLASERCHVPHDGMAEALLIGEYGRRQLAPTIAVPEQPVSS